MKLNGADLSLLVSRSLASTSKAIERSLRRIASGSRVVSAQDGAVDLARFQRLGAQVRGVLQGIRNVNDSLSFLLTAENAIQQQRDLLVRMRDLALRSSNGTVSFSERVSLESEFQDLMAEINRIGESTEYRGFNLLRGDLSSLKVQTGANRQDSIYLSIDPSTQENIFPENESYSISLGTFTTSTTTSGSGGIYTSAVGDLNEDGKDDVVFGPNSDLLYYLGSSGGLTRQSDLTTLDGTGVTITDINEDGNLDIIGIQTTSIRVGLGNGDGTFAAPVVGAAGHSAFSAEVGDVNNDGVPDLITVSNAGNSAGVHLGNGDGTFQTAITYSAPGTGWSVGVGDFNGDNNLDFVHGDDTNSQLQFFFGNGNGTFQAYTTVAVTGGVDDIEIVDINGDNKLDVFVGSSGSANATFFLGNGNGTFGSARTFASIQTLDMELVDVNDDGDLDYIASPSNSFSFAVHFGNGDGTFGSRVTYGVTTTVVSKMAIGDVDGDGVQDIIGYQAGATIPILFGDGETFTADSYSIATQSLAEAVLDDLDTALDTLNENLASLGSQISRLHSINESNETMAVALADARSAVIDLDYVDELAELTRLQMLQSAQISLMSMSNLNEMLVRQLLYRDQS